MVKFAIKHKNKEYLYLIGLFFIFNMPQLFMTFSMTPGLATAQDEFSTIYNAAYFAGNDWAAIGKAHSGYYGYGFLILFTPLFWIFKDGLVIYRIILFCCHMLPLGSTIICYKILKKYCCNIPKSLLFIISIACVTVKGRGVAGIYNEYMLGLCTWLCLYLILKLCTANNKKDRIKNTFILFFILIYSCTVHSRALILYVIVCIIVISLYLLYKKFIISIPTALSMTLFIIPYKIFTNCLQIEMLGGVSSNSSIVMKLSNGFTNSSNTFIEAILFVFMGQLHAVNIVTGGMAAVGLGAFAVTIWNIINRKNGKLIFRREWDENEASTVSGVLYTCLGIAAFAIGMALSTRRGVGQSLIGEGVNINFRAVVLIRYLSSFIGPALMMAFLILLKNKNNLIMKISYIYFWGMQFVYYMYLYQNMKHTGWGTDICLPLTWDLLKKPEDIYLVGGFFVPIYLFMIFLFLLQKNNYFLIALLLIFLGNGEQLYRNIHAMEKANQYINVNAGYHAFRLKEDIFEDIYVLDFENEENQNFFVYQVLLPNIRIIPQAPDIEEEEVLLLCNSENYEDGTEYTKIKLDDNEWLYIRGRKNIEKLKYLTQHN